MYIELPAEDPMSEEGDLVGKLDKAMYGTRDAPAEWQAELEKTMFKLVFRQVVSTPCLYYHSSLDVLDVGHADDLMCVGPRIGFGVMGEIDVHIRFNFNFSLSWAS